MVDSTRARALGTAVELMHFAYRAMIAGPDAILARRGLTRVHHRILYFVARMPGESVNSLLRTLGVTKQALNGPLRTLYQQGLLTFERSSQDGRVKRLQLTATGRRLERRLATLQQAYFADAFAAAGAQAEAGWRAAMQVLAAAELVKAGRTLPGIGSASPAPRQRAQAAPRVPRR